METKKVHIDRIGLKKKMLEACIKKHQTVIDDLRQGMAEMLGTEGSVNEGEPDLSRVEMAQRANLIEDQVRFANEEMKLLYDLLPAIDSIHSQVKRGSVVVTNRGTFFVSVSIERFEAGGLEVFGLSSESPLFKAMEGKKKGDMFTYNNKDIYRIKEVF